MVLCPLASRQLRHHQHVTRGCFPIGTGSRDHAFEDEQLAVSRLHRLRQTSEDLLADIIGPIVQDGVHEVGSGSLDGLLGQEVVRHALDRGIDVFDIFDNSRTIL